LIWLEYDDETWEAFESCKIDGVTAAVALKENLGSLFLGDWL